MFDLQLVRALYDIQHDESATAEEREEAKQKIAAIADQVAEEYLDTLRWKSEGGRLSFGRKEGGRLFENCEVLWARNCLEVGDAPPIEDKIANVLLHRKYSQHNQ